MAASRFVHDALNASIQSQTQVDTLARTPHAARTSFLQAPAARSAVRISRLRVLAVPTSGPTSWQQYPVSKAPALSGSDACAGAGQPTAVDATPPPSAIECGPSPATRHHLSHVFRGNAASQAPGARGPLSGPRHREQASRQGRPRGPVPAQITCSPGQGNDQRRTASTAAFRSANRRPARQRTRAGLHGCLAPIDQDRVALQPVAASDSAGSNPRSRRPANRRVHTAAPRTRGDTRSEPVTPQR